jgi:CelD/BcsL family acetyltransferase involved in cellulose biosynthesis
LTPNHPQPNAARWRGEVKRIGDLTESEIALWRRLAATCHELRSPFFSFEFACAVAEAGADAFVSLLYDGRELAGFFPFQFATWFRRSMAAGQRIGGELNDFCGVLIDQACHGSLEIRRLLRCAGLESFEVSHMEEAQPQLGLRFGVHSQGARIKLAGDPTRYWQSVKSDHPSDYETLRRRERKIEREFRSVEFVFASRKPEELLELVVAEKRRQYQRTNAEDGLAAPWKLRCLERIARYREGRCLPVLSSLHIGGNWAALHFGVRADNVLHYWLPVYNPDYSRFSPGLVLLANMIREATNHGVDEIDLGEGLSRYKLFLGTEFYPTYRDFWQRRSPRALAYRGYVSLLWRVQRIRARRTRRKAHA